MAVLHHPAFPQSLITERQGVDLPLPLSQDEFGEIGMQLILLADALLLHAVPALLLGVAQGAGNVITKIQTLLLSQVVCCWENTAQSSL